ncbi:MAG: hypothetical protein QOF86_3652, partial [Baekduia sp.]|nr:hypothetical protein [Baekduia sp.]
MVGGAAGRLGPPMPDAVVDGVRL